MGTPPARQHLGSENKSRTVAGGAEKAWAGALKARVRHDPPRAARPQCSVSPTPAEREQGSWPQSDSEAQSVRLVQDTHSLKAHFHGARDSPVRAPCGGWERNPGAHEWLPASLPMR